MVARPKFATTASVQPPFGEKKTWMLSAALATAKSGKISVKLSDNHEKVGNGNSRTSVPGFARMRKQGLDGNKGWRGGGNEAEVKRQAAGVEVPCIGRRHRCTWKRPLSGT